MRDWLKTLRVKNGKTQIDVAKALGISQSSYCKIETMSRQTDLSLSMAMKIAETFKISLEKVALYEHKFKKY